MASVTNFMFENMSRIGVDESTSTQSDIQNVQHTNYMLQNFYSADCTMSKPIGLATSQPGVFYKGGKQVASGGCNIDSSTELELGITQMDHRSRLDMFHRPFATIPYLGRGSVNPVMESQILQGELLTNKRSITNLSEKSYINYHHTPMIESMKVRVNNPANYVEGAASDGWVRGGVPSRELSRSTHS